MIERKVLLADDCAANSGGHFTQLPVHRVRPDVVGRRAVDLLCPRFLHQPRNHGVDLLRWHRARAEDQRVTFLSLVLLRVDVELPALHYGRALDSLPRRAVNATEDHVDLILLHELPGFGFRNTIRRCTILEVQIYLPPQQATLRIDVIDHHFRHVRVGDTQKREWTRYVGDYAYLDGRC